MLNMELSNFCLTFSLIFEYGAASGGILDADTQASRIAPQSSQQGGLEGGNFTLDSRFA
jgi:hypothetical protein